MKIFICLDDNSGMMFNGRRQSRDAFVVRDIMSSIGESVLNIDKYSQVLFKAFEHKINVVDSFDSGFCFIENKDVTPYLKDAKKLVIYKWNRKYPSDMRFTADFSAFGFSLYEVNEFKGRSHDIITKETYVK